MYAVVKLGGKQWRLQVREKILVDKLPIKENEQFIIGEVLLLRKKDDVLIGNPFVEKAVVVTKILEQTRDKKIIVFKKKRRKGYKKKQGHRQYKTLLLVEKILLDDKNISDDAEIQKPKLTKANTKEETTKVEDQSKPSDDK